MCSIKDCNNEVAARGMCWKHYRRELRHGDPDKVLIIKNCEMAGCDEPHYAKGKCRNHYRKERYQNRTLNTWIEG